MGRGSLEPEVGWAHWGLKLVNSSPMIITLAMTKTKTLRETKTGGRTGGMITLKLVNSSLKIMALTMTETKTKTKTLRETETKTGGCTGGLRSR